MKGDKFDDKGVGKIKTGPRELENKMRVRQSAPGAGRKCKECGSVYEDGECPMC